MKIAFAVAGSDGGVASLAAGWSRGLSDRGHVSAVLPLDADFASESFLQRLGRVLPRRRDGKLTRGGVPVSRRDVDRLLLGFDQMGGEVDVLHCVGVRAAGLLSLRRVRGRVRGCCAATLGAGCADVLGEAWTSEGIGRSLGGGTFVSGVGDAGVGGVTRAVLGSRGAGAVPVSLVSGGVDTAYWYPDPSAGAPRDVMRVLVGCVGDDACAASGAVEAWGADGRSVMTTARVDAGVFASDSGVWRDRLWSADVLVLAGCCEKSAGDWELCSSGGWLAERALACGVPVVRVKDRVGDGVLEVLRRELRGGVIEVAGAGLGDELDRLLEADVRARVGTDGRMLVVEYGSLAVESRLLEQAYRGALGVRVNRDGVSHDAPGSLAGV